MRSILPFIVAGALLAVTGVSVPPATFAVWLDPQATGEHLIAITQGAAILKACVIIDGVLLLVIGGLRARRGNYVVETSAAPLWTPYSEAPAGTEISDRAFAAGVITLISIAAILRWIGLNSDLWIDEVFTLVNYVRSTTGQILTDFSNDNQHLLYSLLARGSINLFGENPAALRLPAVLFGLGSLWAIARLASLTLGRREALFTVALLAFSYHHVWFSQNARGYTMLLFATILATELLLRGLATGHTRIWLAYAATLALGAWAHLTMVFVMASHGIVVLALVIREGTFRNGGWRPFAALALAGWLTFQLYALVLPQLLDFFLQPAGGSTAVSVEWKSPLWLINEIIRHMGVGLAVGSMGLACVAIVFGWGFVRCARRDWVLTTAATLPAVLGGTVMILLGRNLWPRFFFNELGFAALFAVLGMLAVGEALGRSVHISPRRFSATLAGLLCLVSAASLPKVYFQPKQNFTGARDFVRAQQAEADQVVALDIAGDVYHRYYAAEWPKAKNLAELEAYRAREGRTWVLYTLPRYIAASQPELARVLEKEFELVRVFPGTLGDGAIIVRRSRQVDDNKP